MKRITLGAIKKAYGRFASSPFGRTLNRLIIEMGVGLICALGWMYLNWQPGEYLKNITTFGACLFTVSWFTGQFIRVKKQTSTEDNFQNIESRLKSLIGQIETRTKDLVGHVTGGDSFCYFKPHPVGDGSLYSWMAIHVGKHPIHEVNVRVVEYKPGYSGGDEALNVYWLLPSRGAPAGHTRVNIYEQAGYTVSRKGLFIVARNGAFHQTCWLALVNDHWCSAIYIQRDAADDYSIVFRQVDDNFPRELLDADPAWITRRELFAAYEARQLQEAPPVGLL